MASSRAVLQAAFQAAFQAALLASFALFTGCDSTEEVAMNAAQNSEVTDSPSVTTLNWIEQPKARFDIIDSSVSHWDNYDCFDGDSLPGAEKVYAIDLEYRGMLAAEIDTLQGTNLAVAIMKAPIRDGDQPECLSVDPARAVAEELAPGTYWVVVDGEKANSGDLPEFRIAIEPEAYDRWVDREVDEGIVWQRFYGYESALQINVLRMSKYGREEGFFMKPSVVGDGCLSVDRLRRRDGAIAGINASFHARTAQELIGREIVVDQTQLLDPLDKNTRECTPFKSMIKADGQVYSHNLRGASGGSYTMGFDVTGEPHMEVIMTDDNWDEMPNAVGGWPQLTPDFEDVTNGHPDTAPRTVLGLDEAGDILMVTVDGRTSLGDGLDLRELRDLMVELGAVQSTNLDGGGSTTMWIEGTTLNGVVNFPSDDWMWGTHPTHRYPRAVSDGLYVFAQ